MYKKIFFCLFCTICITAFAGCSVPEQDIISDTTADAVDTQTAPSDNSADNSAEAPDTTTTEVIEPITQLDLTLSTSGDLSRLSDYPQLESLNIKGRGFDDFAPIVQCKQLKWLDARGNSMTSAAYDALASALPECEILWDVPLLGNTYENTCETITLPEAESVTMEELSNIRYLPALKSLDLRQWRFTPAEMDAISALAPQAELLFSFTLAGIETDSTAESLDISGQTIENFEEFMICLRFMPQLTYLDMCNCGLDDSQMEELQSSFPNVKFVWIVHMLKWSLRTDTVAFSTKNASDSAVKLCTEDIQVLRYCTDLVALDLGHQLIDDISVIGQLTNLKALVLVDNIFSDLTPLNSLTKLEFVELYANPNITDITPLIAHPSLKEINISKCPGITDFSPFLEMDSIEMLYMNDTSCSMDMLYSLRQAHPDALIHCESRYSNGNGWRNSQRYKAMFAMFDGNFIHELFLDPESTGQ